MSLQSALILIFTVFTSVGVVVFIILLGWLLIWKAFLSKFRLVRELLGHGNGAEERATSSAADRQPALKSRKLRKE